MNILFEKEEKKSYTGVNWGCQRSYVKKMLQNGLICFCIYASAYTLHKNITYTKVYLCIVKVEKSTLKSGKRFTQEIKVLNTMLVHTLNHDVKSPHFHNF